jgi:SAM-dependent methyltransferase
VEVAPCPVCGHRRAVPTYEVEGLTSRVVVCEQCGLGSLHPMPSEAQIATFYPQEYYGETGTKFEPLVERMVRLVADRHARFLMRGLKPGAKILDVGCGRGVLLRAFADMGYEAHGVEVSETAAEGVDPRAQVRIASHLRDAKYPAGYFDRVVIWHVLEHLTDPRETIVEIERILRPGGRMIVAVPNFSSMQSRWAKEAWFHLDLPRHLYHFPSQALKRLVEACGFECRAMHHFSLRQNPFGWVQSALNRNTSIPRNSLYTMLQRGNGAESRALPASTRRKLRLAYYLGMPVALGISLVMAALRSGATVHIVAKKPG